MLKLISIFSVPGSSFSYLMQRIFKCCGIQNTSIILTPDKELNILIYRMPSYVIIWKSYTLLKMVQFFWPTLYKLYFSEVEPSPVNWNAPPLRSRTHSIAARAVWLSAYKLPHRVFWCILGINVCCSGFTISESIIICSKLKGDFSIFFFGGGGAMALAPWISPCMLVQRMP